MVNMRRMTFGLSCLLVASLAYGAVTQNVVSGYNIWTGSETSAHTDRSFFNPQSGTAKAGSPVTFTAVPTNGLKVIGWYKAPKSSAFTENYTLLQTGGDTYTWNFDSAADATVHLALKLDWITYTLKYNGAGHTGGTLPTDRTYVYTDKVTIASALTRTGYDFVSWTNVANGAEYAPGKTNQTGGNFKDLNGVHEDGHVVTLAAKWNAHTYTVRFHANSGVGSDVDQSMTYDTSADLRANSFSRTGYDFAGWAETTDGDVKYKDQASVKNLSKDQGAVVNLYAVWTVQNYRVTLSASGSGSVSADPSGPTYAYGTSVRLTATPAEGSLFGGWADGNSENPRTVTVVGETTYTANFTSQVFKVDWLDDSRFGGAVLKSELVAWGTDATAPADPEHLGYTFRGWAQDGRSIKQQKTINATYEANHYTVKLYRNDGTADFTSQGYVYDAPDSTLPQNTFTRTGYRFRGWGTNATEKVVVYEDKAVVHNWATGGEVAIYAVWEANGYTIQFLANGGEGEMSDQAFVYDTAQALTMNAFTRGELGFLGWNGSDGKTYADGQVVSNLTAVAGAVITMTARWAGTYHVAFDGNGATNDVPMANQDFAGPEDVQNLTSNAYGRTGYAFAGWATNRADAAQLKNLYADGARVSGLGEPGETVTLYAAWNAITYFVAYNAGKGVTVKELPVATVRYDESFALPVATNEYYQSFDPEKYTFGGWTDGITGAKYADQQTVSNLCTVAGATNTLTAVWKLDVGEWSEHMHCTTLRWGIKPADIKWAMMDGPTYGCTNTGMCVSQFAGNNLGQRECLTATVTTNGVLSFSCRREMKSNGRVFLLVGEGTLNYQTALRVELNDGEWVRVEKRIELPEGSSSVDILLAAFGAKGSEEDSVQIDQMVWGPDGGEPENPEPQPGVDNPSIEDVTLANGKLTIRSTGDAKFGYRVLKSASLAAPITWEPLDETYQGGVDAGQSFELPVDPAEPQMFYKVEVLKKR